ncbi:MAG: DNA-3-methyladenine glycosylase 2 family protein [Planctomycetes bacterium]|nr:DNA-3-methyladenine glycosylase 2 family protein [Planctomycetota bacterium]
MKPTPAELRALARRDPQLGRALKRLPPFPGFPERGHPRQRSHFASLSSAIVYQQLATKAAETIWKRVCALDGGRAFPEPALFLAHPDEHLRAAGLSRGKIAALRDLCTRIEEGRLVLARLSRLSDERVVEELVEVRGIGRWSAQMFLMFRLGRLDVLADGDLGVQEGLRLLDGLSGRPSAAQVAERARVWSPLASVGCWAMWRLVDEQRAAR